MPIPTASVYSATKAAVDAITVSLAGELGPKQIRVNAINPGMVETEGLIAAGIAESDFRKHTEATTPLGRIAQPKDIAKAAVRISLLTTRDRFVRPDKRFCLRAVPASSHMAHVR